MEQLLPTNEDTYQGSLSEGAVKLLLTDEGVLNAKILVLPAYFTLVKRNSTGICGKVSLAISEACSSPKNYKENLLNRKVFALKS